MVRYLITTAGAVAMLSGVALAQDTTSTTTITRSPEGVSKTTTEKHLNSNGDVVTDKKTVKENGYGSSMSDTKTFRDPASGETVTRTRTTTDR